MTPPRDAGRNGSLYLSIGFQLITIVFIAQVTVVYTCGTAGKNIENQRRLVVAAPYLCFADMEFRIRQDWFLSKGEWIMNNTGTDRAWQQIQAKVEELLRQSIAGNHFYRIEYKPADAVHLLEMPQEHKESQGNP